MHAQGRGNYRPAHWDNIISSTTYNYYIEVITPIDCGPLKLYCFVRHSRSSRPRQYVRFRHWVPNRRAVATALDAVAPSGAPFGVHSPVYPSPAPPPHRCVSNARVAVLIPAPVHSQEWSAVALCRGMPGCERWPLAHWFWPYSRAPANGRERPRHPTKPSHYTKTDDFGM